VLAALPEIGSRALAARMIADGEVLVDGREARKSERLRGGETIEYEQPEERAALDSAIELLERLADADA